MQPKPFHEQLQHILAMQEDAQLKRGNHVTMGHTLGEDTVIPNTRLLIVYGTNEVPLTFPCTGFFGSQSITQSSPFLRIQALTDDIVTFRLFILILQGESNSSISSLLSFMELSKNKQSNILYIPTEQYVHINLERISAIQVAHDLEVKI
ncbi:MAG: hypothetical protein ACRC5C_06620 [Bacilli bacterium]